MLRMVPGCLCRDAGGAPHDVKAARLPLSAPKGEWTGLLALRGFFLDTLPCAVCVRRGVDFRGATAAMPRPNAYNTGSKRQRRRELYTLNNIQARRARSPRRTPVLLYGLRHHGEREVACALRRMEAPQQMRACRSGSV